MKGRKRSQLGDADASKTGLQSLEQSIMGPMVVDLNPRPDPDAMDVDVDSKRGEPAREKPIVKSRKRPRIGNRVLREQPPMATISLPPELLVEIFKYLRPADLFSLDQLEAFRNLLIGESPQSIWKAVMKNVRGLPDCPTGFSERQYLAVLFSKFCTFCGSAENCTMDTTLLVRLCGVCADECLALLIDVDKVPEKVRDFLHRSNVFGEGYGGQLPDARVLRSNVQQIVNALDENDWPENDNALIRLKQQWEGEVLERKELSKKIIRALELLENDLACERREIRIQRRREIARRCIDDLKIQKWDLQLQLSWSSPSQKEFYKLVNKPGLLYDREWRQVSPKLKRLIKAQLAIADKEQEERRRTESGYLGEVRLPGQPLFLEIDSVMDGIYDAGGIELLI